MNNHDLQVFLQQFSDDAVVEVWVKVNDEELSSPNMATITRDEIFDYQDKLDELMLDDDNFLNIFHFVDDLLDELESRLQLAPGFIEEMRSIIEDDSIELVPLDLDGIWSFDELINRFHTARTIRDLYDVQEHIRIYVEGKIQGVKVRVHNSSLFIERQDNASCSTSIIADILGIDSKRINDKQWLDGVWIIDLKEL